MKLFETESVYKLNGFSNMRKGVEFLIDFVDTVYCLFSLSQG